MKSTSYGGTPTQETIRASRHVPRPRAVHRSPEKRKSPWENATFIDDAPRFSMIFLLKSEVFSFIRWLSSNQGSYFGIFASIFIHKKGGDSLKSPCSVCEKCNPSRDYHPNSSIFLWCPPWGTFHPGFPEKTLSNQSTAPPVHEIACYIETQSRRRWQCPLCGIPLRNGGASRFGDVSHQAQKDVYGLLKSYIYICIIVYDYIYIYVSVTCIYSIYSLYIHGTGTGWKEKHYEHIMPRVGRTSKHIIPSRSSWHQPSCPAPTLSHSINHGTWCATILLVHR